VFGGAFDPPHLAHVALAHAALTQAKLDSLLVIPTGHAWHKTRTLSPATDRMAMARLAFQDLAGVLVDDREITRAGPTYTVDTLEALQRENPQATLLLFIGEDQAAAFTTWHRWQSVLEVATVFIAEREGTISENGRLNTLDGLRDALQGAEPVGNRLQPLMLPPMAISATDIRQRAAKGLGISHLVPEAVAGYIAQYHLYRIA
jgi:nicotinate-nucleotide adenylyltransferase